MLVVRLPAALLAATLSLTACGGPTAAGDGDGPLDVVVGLYPYAYLLERIGGDDVRVESLAVQGVEPHDLELSPQQAAAVADADLVVLSRGFSPALDDAAGQSAADRSVDVLDLVEVLPYRDAGADAPLDPHVWLDPVRLARITDGLAERLAQLDPGAADDLRRRSAEVRTDLAAVDEDLRAGLAGCVRKELVTSHDAFAYFAERYGLRHVPVVRSPEDEPSPRRLAEVSELVRSSGVTTVYAGEAGSADVLQQLARGTGVQVADLPTLETPQGGEDYLGGVREHLAAVRSGLGCP